MLLRTQSCAAYTYGHEGILHQRAAQLDNCHNVPMSLQYGLIIETSEVLSFSIVMLNLIW